MREQFTRKTLLKSLFSTERTDLFYPVCLPPISVSSIDLAESMIRFEFDCSFESDTIVDETHTRLVANKPILHF